MAITKQDCLLLLTELKANDVECDSQFKEMLKNDVPPLSILQFINDNRPLDVTLFYEKLRKSYNSKKSKLYINIVRNEFKDPKDIITTLAALCLQIVLYNKQAENPNLFLKHSRFNEITACLNNYGKTNDLIPSQRLLELVKADLKTLEIVNRRKTI